ncbi:BPI fold-containing family A member 2 [Grammomys surdaster]|uniref:BPI fold-containing family A member 2 n=1 Tax=Grammomys surdaster TaxID=491861 RepID=UPI0010A03519|nr:BPI fold-containing family A member 2 [Grammomys surdaster]
MFQLGSLVVLCGLLIGTSESLLGNLGNAVSNLNVLDTVSDVPQNLNLDVESLQQATSLTSVKDNILAPLNNINLGNLNQLTSLNGLLLKVNKLKVLDIQAELSSDGKGVDLKLPLVVDISVVLPVVGKTADLAVSLDLINSLGVQVNAQTGLPEVTVGKCSSNSDKISISLLGRRFFFINSILDSISSLLTSTVSTLVQNILCPTLQHIVRNLNAGVIQGLLSNLTGQLPVSI